MFRLFWPNKVGFEAKIDIFLICMSFKFLVQMLQYTQYLIIRNGDQAPPEVGFLKNSPI